MSEMTHLQPLADGNEYFTFDFIGVMWWLVNNQPTSIEVDYNDLYTVTRADLEEFLSWETIPADLQMAFEEDDKRYYEEDFEQDKQQVERMLGLYPNTHEFLISNY